MYRETSKDSGYGVAEAAFDESGASGEGLPHKSLLNLAPAPRLTKSRRPRALLNLSQPRRRRVFRFGALSTAAR